MTNRESRVTTREFYRALLEIKPQLQRIDDTLADLQRWARGDDGAESRLKAIDERLDKVEERHFGEDSRRKTGRTLLAIAQTLFYAFIALISAFIGRNWN